MIRCHHPKKRKKEGVACNNVNDYATVCHPLGVSQAVLLPPLWVSLAVLLPGVPDAGGLLLAGLGLAVAVVFLYRVLVATGNHAGRL